MLLTLVVFSKPSSRPPREPSRQSLEKQTWTKKSSGHSHQRQCGCSTTDHLLLSGTLAIFKCWHQTISSVGCTKKLRFHLIRRWSTKDCHIVYSSWRRSKSTSGRDFRKKSSPTSVQEQNGSKKLRTFKKETSSSKLIPIHPGDHGRRWSSKLSFQVTTVLSEELKSEIQRATSIPGPSQSSSRCSHLKNTDISVFLVGWVRPKGLKNEEWNLEEIMKKEEFLNSFICLCVFEERSNELFVMKNFCLYKKEYYFGLVGVWQAGEWV